MGWDSDPINGPTILGGAAQFFTMGRRGVAGAGLSGAKEAPVDAGVAPSGASLPLVAPAPATPSQLETLSGPAERGRALDRQSLLDRKTREIPQIRFMRFNRYNRYRR